MQIERHNKKHNDNDENIYYRVTKSIGEKNRAYKLGNDSIELNKNAL